jgi:hypothetical protein
MTSVTHIIFRDLVTGETEAFQDLTTDQSNLEQRPRGALTPDERQELDRIKAVLAHYHDHRHQELIDPLFVAARDLFNDSGIMGVGRALLNHVGGALRVGAAHGAGANAGGGARKRGRRADVAETQITDEDVIRVSQVLGILAANKSSPPRLTVLEGRRTSPAGVRIVADTTDPAYRDFTAAFYAAVGEAHGEYDIAKLVLPILQQEGDSDGRGGSPGEVDTGEFALVMRSLVAADVTALEPQLRRRVNEALDTIQAVGTPTPITDMSINLPDLDLVTNYTIESSNVEAIGPMICAAMFDELKAFQVVDKLVELSQNGMLPISVSGAGAMLYQYWKDTPNRMSEGERRNFYALTLGQPGGSVNGSANKDFNDLWIRMVSSVSQVVRQKTADQLLRAQLPAGITQQQVRKAARDLAMNLSAHGYGMVNCAARDLQDQINKMIKLLDHPDIKNAYGAKDMWQVIDQVATLELGGARNSARYRTLATCGAIITKWLAQNVTKFNKATSIEPVIDVDLVLSKFPPSAGPKATSKPTDYDFVNACELWIADTAVSEDRVEQLAQPHESPAMTSKPIPIPAVARDLLEQAIPPGLGIGMGLTTRH